MKKKLSVLLPVFMLCLPLFALTARAAEPVPIDSATFPDEALRSYVASHFDKNGDSKLSAGEIESANEIYLSGQALTSLKGLSLFTNLEKLGLNDCNISSIDLSAVPSVKNLIIKDNKLTSFDAGMLPELTYLDVYGSPITELDVSKNPLLGTLDVRETAIKTLDLSGTPKLADAYKNGEWDTISAYEAEEKGINTYYEYSKDGNHLWCSSGTQIIVGTSSSEASGASLSAGSSVSAGTGASSASAGTGASSVSASAGTAAGGAQAEAPSETQSAHWENEGGLWYFYNEHGNKLTGWLNDGGKDYYLAPHMLTGWQMLNDRWVYFRSDGSLARNAWCGGYWVNDVGTWNYPYIGSWHQDDRGWWYGDTSGWYEKDTIVEIDEQPSSFDKDGYWTGYVS